MKEIIMVWTLFAYNGSADSSPVVVENFNTEETCALAGEVIKRKWRYLDYECFPVRFAAPSPQQEQTK